MRILIIVLLAALAGCGNQAKVHDSPDYSGHPIIGSWSFDNNGCTETFIFSPDGVRHVTSNKEIVEASYRISTSPSDKGLYKLEDKVLKDNGKQDCSGSTSDMTGDMVTIFVSFSTRKDKIMFCLNENGSNCFGPFIRVSEMH